MGEKIRELRRWQNMSQSELARRSGISRQTLSALEHGKLKSVMTGTLEAIAQALGVSVHIFFDNSVR